MPYVIGFRVAWAFPKMPAKPKRKMNSAATSPPRMKAPTMVLGSAKNARSVKTGSKKG
jgi:hypothetical protein